MKSKFWKLFYSSWKRRYTIKQNGYSILMMVPGDLPVFLKIALQVCAAQNPDHLVEVLVIPDKLPKGFVEYFEKLKMSWKNSPIRLVTLNPVELFLTKILNNPNSNNWLQFVRGCNSANTTHVLWHDADLFLTDKDFLKNHYELCRNSNFACFGVSEVWDLWYRENGYPHITATWELMLEMEWVRKFKPWQHRGHDGYINNQKRMFDSTLLPQCLTPAERIGYQKDFHDFVHFNYVISRFRFFQNCKGVYEDIELKILLIRILIDLFDDSDWEYDIPSFHELLASLKNGHGRVTYRDDYRKIDYVEFRSKLMQLKNSFPLNERQKVLLEEKITFMNPLLLKQRYESSNMVGR